MTDDKSKSKAREALPNGNLAWKQLHHRIKSSAKGNIMEDSDLEVNDPNTRHTMYYQIQLFANTSHEEWSKFVGAMAVPLNVTFRISNRCNQLMEYALQHYLLKQFKKLPGHCLVDSDGNVIRGDVIKKIEWLPNSFQVAVESSILSKDPSLEGLSTFLRRECLLGNVVRQELVSMIPALLLDIKSNHWIMDMCAAPGSKTEQLLSLMYKDLSSAINRGDTIASMPSGLVVANDIDPKRLRTLTQRFTHHGSPNLIFTCSKAEDLPKSNAEVFDRVLCDVPCSGDGTFRKRPYQWRLFRPRVALDLHSIQLQIAASGFYLLKPGGRLVYSTCSLNPIEDEAVVAALLALFGDAIELLDVNDPKNFGGIVPLPLLRYRPGISYWQCNEEVFTVGEEDEAARAASRRRLPPILPTMIPPVDQSICNELHKCLRLLPHDQDTGGFFVAVFLKKKSTDSPPHLPINVSTSVKTVKTETASKSIASLQVVSHSKSEGKKVAKGTVFDPKAKIASMNALKSLGYNPKTLVIPENTKPSSQDTFGGAFGDFSFITEEKSGLVAEICENIVLDRELVNSSKNLVNDESTKEAEINLLLYEPRAAVDPAAATGKKELVKTASEPVKKKRKFAGKFGPQSKGWEKEESDYSGNEKAEGDAVDLTKKDEKKVFIVSSSVRRAVNGWLKSWGSSILIVQAGLEVASLTANRKRKNIGPQSNEEIEASMSGLKSLHRNSLLLTSRVVWWCLDDFLAASRMGSRGKHDSMYSIRRREDRSRESDEEEVLLLSDSGFESLLQAAKEAASGHLQQKRNTGEFTIIPVSLCPQLLKEYWEQKKRPSSSDQQESRKGPRLSKAERKKLKTMKESVDFKEKSIAKFSACEDSEWPIGDRSAEGLLIVLRCLLKTAPPPGKSIESIQVSIATSSDECISIAESLTSLIE